ncbi:cupin domain-containing protein [bacterium]|nr:MAG: cupin domain-containing protein [bacterium]
MDIKNIKDISNFSDTGPGKNLASSGTHARVTVWCLKKGQDIHPHIHEGDHVWVVEEGTGYYLNDKGEHKVAAGQIIFAPEGEPHGMRAETDLVFVSVSAGDH